MINRMHKCKFNNKSSAHEILWGCFDRTLWLVPTLVVKTCCGNTTTQQQLRALVCSTVTFLSECLNTNYGLQELQKRQFSSCSSIYGQLWNCLYSIKGQCKRIGNAFTLGGCCLCGLKIFVVKEKFS